MSIPRSKKGRRTHLSALGEEKDLALLLPPHGKESLDNDHLP